MDGRGSRILTWTLVTGAVCFALGFFGPIILAPDANQGPLLGIFITGPLGLVLGLTIGIIREMRGSSQSPLELLSGFDWTIVLRVGAGALGMLLLLRGTADLAIGAERPAAAGIVIGIVLVSYAAMGRVPGWFRR